MSAGFTELDDGVRRDRCGRYMVVPADGGKPRGMQRVTTLAKIVEDTSNLMDWACRMTALGLAQRPDLLSSVMVADPEDRKALNAVVERAKEAGGATVRRDLGTSLHKMVERSHADSAWTVPEPYAADVAAVNAAIDAHGYDVVVEFSERILVLDEYGLAGMCDLVLRRRTDGALFVADLKTGASVKYGALGWSVQLTAYAHADCVYVQGGADDGSEDQRLPAPAVDRTVGIILHAQPGSGTCDLYHLELSLERLELAVAVREARKAKGLLTPVEIVGGGNGTGWPVPPAPSTDGPVHVTDALTAVMHQARVAWVLNRIELVKAHDAAPATMARLWPDTVRRPRDVPGGPGNWTADELAAVVAVLDAVEGEHDMAFGDEDPATAAGRAAESERRATYDAEVVRERTDHADPDAVQWLRLVLAQMTVDEQELVLRWIGEGDTARKPWRLSPAGEPTPRRRCAIAGAALELAQLAGTTGDDGARHALALVAGEDALQPVFAVGALLGALTIAEAAQLEELCRAHRLATDDHGALSLVAAA